MCVIKVVNSVGDNLKRLVSILRKRSPNNVYELESNRITSALHVHFSGNCKEINEPLIYSILNTKFFYAIVSLCVCVFGLGGGALNVKPDINLSIRQQEIARISKRMFVDRRLKGRCC